MALILLCEEDIDPTGSDVRCVRNDRICDIILQLYLSAQCQITPLTKNETEPQIRNTIIPVWGSARVNPKPGKLTTLQRKSILGALKVEIDFNFFSGLTKHVENVFFAKNGISFGQVLPREHHL